MKQVFFSGLMAVAALCTFASSGSALQDTGSPAGPGIVAVLDVVRVFNENADHAAEMERIRQAAEGVKAGVDQELEKIRTDAQPLLKMEQGSPERNDLEAQLEQRQTALKTKARQQEMDLLTAEAQVYYKTWTRMQQIVTSVANHNRISLVLRFDSASMDPENRADVIKGVNRSVVFQDNLDLTDMVIQQMGPTVANAAVGPVATDRKGP